MPIGFGYTFPFEGNWNCFPAAVPVRCPVFGYTFPFEGNWNNGGGGSWCERDFFPFGYTFPFEGNWNIDLETFGPGYSSATLDTPSRLKGIETYVLYRIPIPSFLLWIHLPVWRELKPEGSAFSTSTVRLWIHLPVWRELKPLCGFWKS